MVMPVSPPTSQAGTRSGATWASAPMTAFAMRKAVKPRAATAAGGSGLTIVPGGAFTSTARK